MADTMIDLAALGGVVAIVHGVDLVYHPAAFIVGGAMALIGAWKLARRAA